MTDGEELEFCWRLGCGELPCDDIPHLLKYISLFKAKMTYSVEKKWFFRRHSGKEVVAVVPCFVEMIPLTHLLKENMFSLGKRFQMHLGLQYASVVASVLIVTPVLLDECFQQL